MSSGLALLLLFLAVTGGSFVVLQLLNRRSALDERRRRAHWQDGCLRTKEEHSGRDDQSSAHGDERPPGKSSENGKSLREDVQRNEPVKREAKNDRAQEDQRRRKTDIGAPRRITAAIRRFARAAHDRYFAITARRNAHTY